MYIPPNQVRGQRHTSEQGQWWNSKLRARRSRKMRMFNKRLKKSSNRYWEEKCSWCFSWVKQIHYLDLKDRFDDWKNCRSPLEHGHGLLIKERMKEILRQILRGKMYLMFFLVWSKMNILFSRLELLIESYRIEGFHPSFKGMVVHESSNMKQSAARPSLFELWWDCCISYVFSRWSSNISQQERVH